MKIVRRMAKHMAKVRVEKMAYAQDISETESGVRGKIVKYFHLNTQFVQHLYVYV